MQSIISSNQKSVTEAKMVEMETYDPVYGSEASFPKLGIQFQKVSPYITAAVPHNNSITFKLPPGAGFLYEASLGFLNTYTISADDNLSAPIGINMIRSLEWLSNGQPISYKTGPALWSTMKTANSSSFQKFSLRYAGMLNPNTEGYAAAADTSFVTYCPLPESFLMEIEKALLLNKITDLQLRVTFNTVAECGLVTGGGITAFTPTLYVQTYMPELSAYQKMVEEDWSKRLVMQATNTYTELTTLSSTTTASYTITCPFLAYKTHVFVRGVTATNDVGLANAPLKSITMNLNGVTFLDTMPTSRMISNAAKYGVCNDEVVGDDVQFAEDIVTIDWGLLAKRTQNTGTAFWQELKGTNLSVVIAEAVGTAANYRLYVIHEYFNTVAFDSGVLSIDSNN